MIRRYTRPAFAPLWSKLRATEAWAQLCVVTADVLACMRANARVSQDTE